MLLMLPPPSVQFIVPAAFVAALLAVILTRDRARALSWNALWVIIAIFSVIFWAPEPGRFGPPDIAPRSDAEQRFSTLIWAAPVVFVATMFFVTSVLAYALRRPSLWIFAGALSLFGLCQLPVALSDFGLASGGFAGYRDRARRSTSTNKWWSTMHCFGGRPDNVAQCSTHRAKIV